MYSRAGVLYARAWSLHLVGPEICPHQYLHLVRQKPLRRGTLTRKGLEGLHVYWLTDTSDRKRSQVLLDCPGYKDTQMQSDYCSERWKTFNARNSHVRLRDCVDVVVLEVPKFGVFLFYMRIRVAILSSHTSYPRHKTKCEAARSGS